MLSAADIRSRTPGRPPSPPSGGQAAMPAAPYRAARVVWVALTALSWSITFYLASHRSELPQLWHRYSTGYFLVVVSSAGVAALLAISNVGVVWNRIRDSVLACLIAAASCVLALGLLEIGIRLVDPLGISYLSAITQYSRHNLADNELIYKQPPSSTGVYGGVSYRFNEL